MTYSTDNKRQNVNNYALVTAAYNEETYIERTMSSVVRQTRLPSRWVVVSDGSTDGTDEIIRSYAARYDFIHPCRITEKHKRSFAAKVKAVNAGFAQLATAEYDYVGNLDADVTIDADYFERLLQKFREDDSLGLAGGFIYERNRHGFKSRRTNSARSVAHAVQLFRRECFELLGGYLPLAYGGEDWHAEVTTRMAGWHVEAFPELKVCHLRSAGGGTGLIRYCFRDGMMDFSLGSDPLFEAVKLARRIPVKPYVVGSLVRLAGFLLGWARSVEQPVSREFVSFLRKEQRARLRGLVAGRYEDAS